MPAQKRAYETADVDLLPRLHHSFNQRSEDGESEGTFPLLPHHPEFPPRNRLLDVPAFHMCFYLFPLFSARVLSLCCFLFHQNPIEALRPVKEIRMSMFRFGALFLAFFFSFVVFVLFLSYSIFSLIYFVWLFIELLGS